MPGARLTLAVVATVRDRLLKEGLLLRLDDEGIARHFTQPFLVPTAIHKRNAWKVSMSQLRDTIGSLEGCPDGIPDDPLDFPRWVRTELLEFAKLPRDELSRLYKEASSDLASIAANIVVCRARIEDIKRRTEKTDADELNVRFYEHYEKTNAEAREEIVAVLTDGMEREAIRAAYGSRFPGLDLHVPWAFRWNPLAFDPATFSPIRHAFGDLPVREVRELVTLHRERPQEFDERLAAHVRTTQPAREIRAMLRGHHLLAARCPVLEPALNAFERGELALFASAVAVQIEGIFEDACLLCGVPYEALRLNTLTPKVDTFLKVAKYRIDFVYYAFAFQVVRNRIAHGRAVGEDLRRVANLLLLDVRDACRAVAKVPAGPNALVEILRERPPLMATVEGAVRFATLYAETDGAAPPCFYALADAFGEMTLAIERQPMWSFLEELLDANRDELDRGVRFVVEKLKGLRDSLRPVCAGILRRLEERGKGRFDRDEFWSALRGKPGHERSAWEVDDLRAALLDVLRAPSRGVVNLLRRREEQVTVE
jgi:hypothetical protein